MTKMLSIMSAFEHYYTPKYGSDCNGYDSIETIELRGKSIAEQTNSKNRRKADDGTLFNIRHSLSKSSTNRFHIQYSERQSRYFSLE
jgi:hypothetical protein